MNKGENFCPVFSRLKQLAQENNLNPENTVLNKDCCPFAQACLAIADPDQFYLLVEQCQIQKSKTPFIRIYLPQNQPPQNQNPLDRFYERLERTLQLRQRS